MADRYLIEGATYCGDGTASNEAASAGAPGAWNNINVLEGTAPAFGTLSAGHVVRIRSKTSAGADITRTLTANTTIGSSSASAGSEITWILDGGTVWPGIGGTLTYSVPSGSWSLTFQSHNHFIAEDQDKFKVLISAATNSSTYNVNDNVRINNWFFDSTAVTAGNKPRFSFSSTDVADLGNIKVKTSGWYQTLFSFASQTKVFIDSLDLELTAAETDPIFKPNYGNIIQVYGGEFYGTGATTGAVIFQGTSNGVLELYGFAYPKTVSLTGTSANPSASALRSFALDKGEGSAIVENWGEATTRSDVNHPTLDAALPDSVGTKFSWRMYPKYASRKSPASLHFMRIFTDTAATKTLTLEMLLADTITAATKSTVYVIWQYIEDSTGRPRKVLTKQPPDIGGALDASTASWSTVGWGTVTCVKRKISVTTPTAVKKDTPVIAVLRVAFASASADDLLFIDPDIKIA